MEMLIDVFTDAAIDCIKMLPFLFLSDVLPVAVKEVSVELFAGGVHCRYYVVTEVV